MSGLYSIGAMNQLADALEQAGFSEEDVTRLKQFRNKDGIKDVLYKRADIEYSGVFIDLDTPPFIPDHYSILWHNGGGLWKWGQRPFLYHHVVENKGMTISDFFTGLIEHPTWKRAWNASILDYLLANPKLIPERYADEPHIIFPGTIYKDGVGNFTLRSLCRDSSGWHSGYFFIKDLEDVMDLMIPLRD